MPLLSWVDPPDAALYFITAKYGHSWSHFRDTGDGSIFIGGKVMRTRVRSPTYGREKKKTTSPEDFTNKRVERRSQNRSKTSRQKTACFSFGFCRKTENQQKTANLRFWLTSIWHSSIRQSMYCRHSLSPSAPVSRSGAAST